MNLDELKQTYLTYPQLSDMKKRWHHGYWDGALSGVCEIEGQLHWFQCVAEFDEYPDFGEDDTARDAFEVTWYRRFLIWTLPADVMATIVKQHEKFRNMVGYHTDYDESGRKSVRYLDPVCPATVETTKAYFAEEIEYPNTLPTNHSQIVGWWEWK